MARKKLRVKRPARAAKSAHNPKVRQKKSLTKANRAARTKSANKSKVLRKRRSTAAIVEAKPDGAERAAPPAQGSFIWHELASTDAQSCRSFYNKLFGWRAAETELMPGFMYTMFQHEGRDVAGMLQMGSEWGEVKSHWMVYIAVRNVDAIVQKAEALGGEVHVPPHDIPTGRIAVIKDPSGALIAVIKAAAKARNAAATQEPVSR